MEEELMRQHAPQANRGIVMFFTLLVLVLIALAAVALVRSVGTSNEIAGNFAFKQGAVHSADIGVEQARAYLLTKTATELMGDAPASGYYAAQTEPADWEVFFKQAQGLPTTTDPTQNKLTYVVHRLCKTTGDASAPTTGCIRNEEAAADDVGNSMSAGDVGIEPPQRLLYRVTVHVAAPRNTTSVIQTVLAI
jgi:type IV pilus assembly protein PilX